jgi:AmmeMemoRadiSam system protein B/AmmeMemoRadiSam system protein A
MNRRLKRILRAGTILIALIPLSCVKEDDQNNREGRTVKAADTVVREPAVAGAFYPARKEELEKTVRAYLAEVHPPQVTGRVVGLVSPHAGYTYSGETAAYGYKLLEGRPVKRAIIIAPSHQVGFHGLSIPQVDAYRTPLGLVPLDKKACEALRAHELFSSVPGAHTDEHSLEVQLPFLQCVLRDFTIVPIVAGQLREEDYEKVAGPLGDLLDGRTIIVASTDFTHYGTRFGYVPFRDNLKENIEKLDRGAIDAVEKGDWRAFLRYQQRTGATICGRCPIAVMLCALGPDAAGRLLHYTTSGDLTGDFSSSVSYVSMVFTVKEEGRMSEETSYLDEEEKKTLLKLAHDSIEALVEGARLPKLADGELTPKLKEKTGVFVTLNKKGNLRGCIGYIEPIKPLWEAVRDNAISAASRDYRFSPVSEDEVDDIHMEISVLTPKKKIDSLNEFVVGKHGIILQKAGRSAVFLPQVAPEQGWGVDETLTHLSMKAGLPPDAWKEGATYYVFEADVFGEK